MSNVKVLINGWLQPKLSLILYSILILKIRRNVSLLLVYLLSVKTDIYKNSIFYKHLENTPEKRLKVMKTGIDQN